MPASDFEMATRYIEMRCFPGHENILELLAMILVAFLKSKAVKGAKTPEVGDILSFVARRERRNRPEREKEKRFGFIMDAINNEGGNG